MTVQANEYYPSKACTEHFSTLKINMQVQEDRF